MPDLINSSGIVKRYFGNHLLFIAHDFQEKRGCKPANFVELFEYIQYRKVYTKIHEAIKLLEKGDG